ncbi:MAG: extracellular solute-binding protein [Bacilli bacterium]
MNFKKSFSTVAFALLACASVGALTSCGEDPERVVFWHTMGKTNQALLNEMIEAFQESDEGKNPDGSPIVVEHAAQGGYTDIKAKLLKAIPAKTTPTMAFAYPDHVAEYINAGAVLKLDDMIASKEYGLLEELADYSIYWSEGTCYDTAGSVYSVPFTKSTEVIFYNATVFKEMGYEIPTSWYNEKDPNDVTTMFGLCRKMKSDYETWYRKHNSTATADQVTAAAKAFVPLGYDSDDNMYITLSEQLGIPYTSLNDDMSGNFDFGGSDLKGNSEARALIKRLRGYYDEGLFVTKGTLPNNTYTSTKFTSEALWMSIGSTGGTSYNKSDKFEVAVAPIPQQDPSNPKVISQGPSICFFKNSKINEQAQINSWKFYKFITSPENTAAYAMLTGYEPVRLSAYESEDYVYHKDITRDDADLYTKVANLTSSSAVTGAYFTSPAFVGSATAREQVGGIITQTMLETNISASHTLDQELDENFYNAMMECLFAV